MAAKGFSWLARQFRGQRLFSHPLAPRDDILAGTAYLRAMYYCFGYPGLFAAYNAGPRRYQTYLLGRSPLPVETQAYLVKVAGALLPGLQHGRSRAPKPDGARDATSSYWRASSLFVGLRAEAISDHVKPVQAPAPQVRLFVIRAPGLCSTALVSAMCMKNTLCNIQTDCGNL